MDMKSMNIVRRGTRRLSLCQLHHMWNLGRSRLDVPLPGSMKYAACICKHRLAAVWITEAAPIIFNEQ